MNTQSSTASQSSANNIISNKYRIIKLLGEGSYGKALLAEDIVSKALLVVKSIIIPGTMSKKDKENAYQEGKILSQLSHPNIIKFTEVIIEKQDICPPITCLHIVMGYADEGDLLQKIKEQQQHLQGKLFQEDQIINWFTQICLAIKHIHDRKILHRDIKSQNIFLTKTGRILLGDFGIAKCLNNTIDKAKTIVGTPYYLSPEIINNEPYEYKSDIWSLGVLLYEMCMLTVPFNAQNFPQLTIKIIKGSYPPVSQLFSKELIGVVKNLLSVNIKQRPTINEILSYPILKSRIRLFLNEDEYYKEFGCGNVIKKFKEEKNKDKKRDRSSVNRSNRKRSNDKQTKSKERNDSYDNYFKPKDNKNGINSNRCLQSQPNLNKNCKSNNQFIYKKKQSQMNNNNNNNNKLKNQSIDFNLSPRNHKGFKSEKKIFICNNINKSHLEVNCIKKTNYPKHDKSNSQAYPNEEENKKNLILEEFMKNKQEKIKHSHQISENINNSIWFKNNMKSIIGISENSIISTKIDMDNLIDCNRNKANNQSNNNDSNKMNEDNNDIDPCMMLVNIGHLHCDNTNVIEDSIKEPSIPSDHCFSNDSSMIAEEANFNEEDQEKDQETNEEVIPLDLDILSTTHKKEPVINPHYNNNNNNYSEEDNSSASPQQSIQSILKTNITTALGSDVFVGLYSFIKNNVTDDIVNYDYSKLTNKFSITYPHITQQQLKKALLYIPDIYFLILTENNSI